MSKACFLLVFVAIACSAPCANASVEVQFYRTEEFNLTYALPSDWLTEEISVQGDALLLGFHTPDADEHSMILFFIPKDGELLEESLRILREQAEAVFAGVREEDMDYRTLSVDGMPAVDMYEKEFSHQVLFIDDMDRYLALVYQSPVFFNDPNYLAALETFVNSVGLLHNAHPYASAEKDYLVIPYRDGVQVIGYTGSDLRIRIPDQISGLPVLAIGAEAFLGLDIQYIALPDTVTRIAERAFSSCADLRGVDLPSGLQFIGDQAFEYCERLLAVSIPDGVSSIGKGAFIGCVRLWEMRLPSSLETLGVFSMGATNIATISIDDTNPFFQVTDNVLFSKDGKHLIFYPQGRTDKNYEVPKGTETICSFAFAQLDLMSYALESVSLPDSLLQIDTGALALSRQRDFFIPSSVKLIEDDAFSKEHKITLYGERGSIAKAYAQKHGFKFVEMNAGGGQRPLSVRMGCVYFALKKEGATSPEAAAESASGDDLYAQSRYAYFYFID